MRNLQEATEKICELKGSLVAMDALICSIMKVMPDAARRDLPQAFGEYAEVARTVLLHAPISDVTIAAFERDVARGCALMETARK